MKTCGFILQQKKILNDSNDYGNTVISVAKGELASGLFGEGRMAEPEEILHFLIENFFRKDDLKGKKCTGNCRTYL